MSALIAPSGTPAQLVRAVLDGQVQPVVCPHLLDELAGVLGREKFRRYVTAAEAAVYVDLIASHAEHHHVPVDVPATSRDSDDDYLIELAERAGTDMIVSRDGDLLALSPPRRVVSPRDLVGRLGQQP